jgi:Cys-tRNA(Pro) deacylase
MSGLPESLLSERGQSAGYFQTELDTRGAAFLAAAGIPFTGIQYFPDRDTSETVSAEHGAAKPKTRAFTDRAGVSEHHIIKTLVFSDSKHTQAFVVLMHGDCRVNTKALSKQIDVKKIVQAPIDVAQDWSGYIMGGTSPFGLRKPMQVFIEKSILEIPGKIIINAGRHDSYHLMSPSDIVAAFNTKHAADAGFGPIREVQCGEVRVPAAAAPESPSAGSPAGDAAASTAGEAALAAAAAAAPAAAAHAAAVPAAAAPVAATGLPASVTTFAALADAVDRTLSELQVLSSMYAHTNVDPDTYTAADAGAAASSSPIDTSGLDVAVADPASVAQLLALRDAFAAKKKAALPTGTDAAAAAAAAGVMWPALSLTVTDSFDDPRGLAAAAGLSSASFRLAIDLPAGYPFVAAAPRPAVAAGTAVVLRARLAAVAEKHCAAGASEAVYDLIETCKAHFALDTLTAPAPAAAAASAAAVGGVAGSAVARAAAGGVLDPASVMVTPLVVMPKGGVITGAAATVAAGGKPQPGPDGRLHLFRPATAPEGLTQAQLIGTGVRCLATGRASVSGGDEDFAVTYQSLRGRLVVGEKGRPKTVLQLSSPLALVPSPEHIKWLGKPKTKIRMGFVGMPNVGKSSLFNLMSGMQVRPRSSYTQNHTLL